VKYKFIYFILIIFHYSAFSQEKAVNGFQGLSPIDSLYYKAMSLKISSKNKLMINDNFSSKKCGLPTIFQVKKNWDKFSALQKKNLLTIWDRPLRQKSILSSNGNFRIHYDTSGYNAPDLTDKNNNKIPDYIDSVAYYFEYCYQVEKSELGIAGLVPDNNMGGGNEYDVYIEELSQGEYGNTTPEDLITSNQVSELYTSYITVDNNFKGYYTSGINGLKVTVAHELFHALQVGNYGIWWDDFYFYELLSTWMEQRVFPSIKDYFQYLSDYFSQTDTPFWKHDGYDLTPFPIYLTIKYSDHIINQLLENIKTYKPIVSIERALRSNNSSFAEALSEFSVWIYFTSFRTIPDKYFPEAENYPVVSGTSLYKYYFSGSNDNIYDYAPNMTSKYYFIIFKSDTINIIQNNINYSENMDVSTQKDYYNYLMKTDNADNSYLNIGNGLFVKFNPDQKNIWKNYYFLNNHDIYFNDILVYPNPLKTGICKKLSFKLPKSDQKSANLYILSSDQRVIAHPNISVQSHPGESIMEWDCKDFNGNIVSSGVYFYYFYFNDKKYLGKIAVINN
jgi:hypothetical protein